MKISRNVLKTPAGGDAGVKLLCLILALTGMVPAVRAESLATNALAQISGLQQEKAARTATQLKMDSQLIYALKQSRNQPIAPGVPRLSFGVAPDATGLIAVDITASVKQDLLDFIVRSGGTVVRSVPRFDSVRAKFPLAQIETLAARADVRFVEPAAPAMTRTGSVNSQGDTTHLAGQGRSAFTVDGSGVRIGVISDSCDFLAVSQATGDLPSDVTILPGQSGIPGSGEGTAMMEIIHDLAPGAKLYFATGFGGTAGFAQNVLDLRAAGCDIIVDDIGYATDPPFQDGVIGRAVNTVTADGALYFSAAGNANNLTHGMSGTWEGDFADGGAAGPPVDGKQGTLHSFGTNAYNTITDFGGGVMLFWSDPLGASTNDYDLYILDGTGNTVLGASTTVQNGAQSGFEGLLGLITNGMRAVVVRAAGDARFLHMDCWGSGSLEVATDGNIRGHPAATNAFATAAVDISGAFPGPFTTSNPVETFSTDGPRRVFFHQNGAPITPGNFSSSGGFLMQKPDLAAADGVSTATPGFDPFFGTSAAAPHAAAIAGLVKSFNPTLTATEMRAVLTSAAATLDIEGAGVDRDAGYGILMANQALQVTPPPRLPVLQVSTNYIVGGNGNGVIDLDECNDFFLVLTNVGLSPATNVQVTISSTNAGVFIPDGTANYGQIETNAAATNLTAFKLGTSPSFICGTPITLAVQVKFSTGTKDLLLKIPTGTNAPARVFANFFPVTIPDNNPIGTNSFVVVTNISGVIQKVTVSLYVSHPYDADLSFELIGPDGTTVQLASANGGAGQNYGLSCFPETSRTTFDDDAATSIANGRSPFLGHYRPLAPLSAFVGKSGTNVNGLWQLRAADSTLLDVGTLQCWYLNVYSASCGQGSGLCPGVDLALSMSAAPSPGVVGTNLVYTIFVTNNGPNIAKGVVVTHNLPSGALFVSATASQGGASYAGGVVTGTLGNMGVGDVARIEVTAVPTIAGTAFSSVSVASTDPELNPLNNAVSIQTLIAPPSCDLAVGLADSPDPTIVGAPLTYVVTVTNKGPATANGVVVTNILPSTVLITSTDSSQGPPPEVIGNVVVFRVLEPLPQNAFASATINVIPQAYGTLTVTAIGSAIQPDPLLANNTAVATTAVGQSSDLGITMTAQPDPVVLGSNLTFTITATNLGPNTATNVTVTQGLPVGVTVVNISLSQGSSSLNGSTLVCSLGTLIPGGSATVRVVVTTPRVGTLTSTATITSAQTDRFSGNNTAIASAQVAPPFVNIVAAGTTLTDENFLPRNGSIEPGETVTIQFRLQNSGNVANTNLLVTLLATGGVLSPSAAQTYGILRPIGVPGGTPVSRPFSFTAGVVSGGVITATLQLQDASQNLPPVTFTFALPQVLGFANSTPIMIPTDGAAEPYPSTINVTGLTGQVGKVTATLKNFSHDYPHDVSVLLVGPGQNPVKALLLSHAGDRASTYNVDLTFDDAADAALPAAGSLPQGTWKPSVFSPSVLFSNPAPAGPYTVLLQDFNGTTGNGTWSLYVLDDHTGDGGVIAGGWSLGVTAVTPVNQLADVGVSVAAAPNPVLVGGLLTYSWIVTNGGPATATGVNFSNALPAFLTLASATVSQGNWTTNGNVLLANFGSLPAGGTATITAQVQPQINSPASVTNTAWVAAFESDLHTGDNRVAAVTTINVPLVGLTVGMTAAPNPVIVGSNLVFTVGLTNNGPDHALSVILRDTLSAGLDYVGATVSQGSVANNNGVVTAALNDLVPGATASLQITVTPRFPGALTNLVLVETASNDAVPSRSASAEVIVRGPAAHLYSSGANLIAENVVPANGTVDRGETVTVLLGLANDGELDAVNLTATLLPSGGVTLPGAPAVYGPVLHGGATVWRSFTFTADPAAGPAVVATLALADGAKPLGTVSFTFETPVVTSISSPAGVGIPESGTGLPYPSAITVSNLQGLVGNVTVTFNQLRHSFPSDLNVLLSSPSAPNVLLMSHNGGSYAITNVNLTFDDSATGNLPVGSLITSGSFRPSRAGASVALPPPAPLAPYGSALAVLKGINPNGTWALYLLDDSTGDGGAIAGGWTLNITTIKPVNPIADLALRLVGSGGSVLLGTPITYTLSVTNSGPGAASNVVLKDILPAGVTILSNSVSQGSTLILGSEVTFELGAISVGGTAIASLTVLPSATGSYLNKASLSGGFTDFTPGNNAAENTTFVVEVLAPRLSATIEDGLLQMVGIGQPFTQYTIEASTGLDAWSTISTNTAGGDGVFRYTDPNTAKFGTRFYRAVRQLP